MNKKDAGIDWKNAWLNLDEEKKIVYIEYENFSEEEKEGEKQNVKRVQTNRKRA